jgi:hypothetical protein
VPDDFIEILHGAQHGHVAPAHLGDRARVVVEEAHRAQSILGVALQPPGHLRAHQTGAHDQHRLAHPPAAARHALSKRQTHTPETNGQQRERP